MRERRPRRAAPPVEPDYDDYDDEELPRWRRSIFWRLRRPIFVLFFLGFAAVSGVLFYLSRLPLPPAAPLSQTSFVYDDSGHPLASFSEQNRVSVSLNQVPQVVIDAVVSTEDRNFFNEGAINPISIARAFVSDLRGNGATQGGSTITQQYVKQAYLTSQRTLTRKIREAAIAIKLEHTESKDQILQNYLNTIYWGRGAYGVQAASEAYFGKPVSQIGLREASLLAGLIREPETADPAHNPTLAKDNQTDTLKDLIRDRKVTKAQAAQVEATPLSAYVVSPHQTNTGEIANVPGDEYFVAAVRQELVAKYGAQEVDNGGLKVTTTLNQSMQTAAYNAVYGPKSPSLDPAKGDPSGALVSVDDSGHVQAMVGGDDYATSQVNLAMGTAGGGSGRQAGSTFKAFMLAEVVKLGYSVESEFPAPSVVVVPHGNANGTAWTVKNFEGDPPSPNLSLVGATANSINTVYAQVVEKIGAQNLDAMAEACGINPAELAGAYPSQVLGTADVSPLEMASAYATFMDGGTYNVPLLITKVTDSSGRVLPLPVAPASRPVLTPDQAKVVDYVLQQVVIDGTGTSAGGLGTPIAGKTGTTENSADAWFIGGTPKLTTAMWMGYPTSSKPMLNFRGAKSVQGGGVPAQIWHSYMKSVLAASPQLKADFPPAYSLEGNKLAPPAAGTLQFPEGMGGTTTTTSVAGSSPSTTTSTGHSSSTTTPPTATTKPTTPATTVPETPTATTIPAAKTG